MNKKLDQCITVYQIYEINEKKMRTLKGYVLKIWK
jgi:hypothetical protein